MNIKNDLYSSNCNLKTARIINFLIISHSVTQRKTEVYRDSNAKDKHEVVTVILLNECDSN